MQRADDLIARLVATYPDEADLVGDVVRGVLDECRREGARPVSVPEAVAGERLARLLRARPVAPATGRSRRTTSEGRATMSIHPHDVRELLGTAVRHHAGQR